MTWNSTLQTVSKFKEDLKGFTDEPILGAYDLGSPEQIAALVSYLVSKEAQFVTGESESHSFLLHIWSEPSLHLKILLIGQSVSSGDTQNRIALMPEDSRLI